MDRAMMDDFVIKDSSSCSSSRCVMCVRWSNSGNLIWPPRSKVFFFAFVHVIIKSEIFDRQALLLLLREEFTMAQFFGLTRITSCWGLKSTWSMSRFSHSFREPDYDQRRFHNHRHCALHRAALLRLTGEHT